MRITLFLVLALPSLSTSFHLNSNGNGNSLRIHQAPSNHVLQYKRSVLFDLRIKNIRKEESRPLKEASSARSTSRSHYSASDWFYNLKTWKNSSVLREIRNPVMALSAWATFVSVVHKVLLMTGKTAMAGNLCIPPLAHSFLVSSLGLLLVFRTNSAYQRFLEGRQIWEQILSVSRNLSRLVTLYRPEVGYQRRQRIQNLLAAFPYLLRHQVRSGCLCSDNSSQIDGKHKLCLTEPTRPEMKCWVDCRDIPWSLIEKAQHSKSDKSVEKIAQVSNRPLWICDRLGQEMMGIPTTPNFAGRERLKLLSEIDKLANAVGSCERIHQTAVPLHYARHALRSLTVWLFTLPFPLVHDFGLLTGPVTAMVAWLLFGVYQIGHSIEDPFQGSLQLSVLCDHIRRDVLACDDSRQSAFHIDSEGNMMDLLPPNPVDQKTLSGLISSAPSLVHSKNGEFSFVGL